MVVIDRTGLFARLTHTGNPFLPCLVEVPDPVPIVRDYNREDRRAIARICRCGTCQCCKENKCQHYQ